MDVCEGLFVFPAAALLMPGFLVSHQLWFNVIGGGFLLYLHKNVLFKSHESLHGRESEGFGV